jgi:hypothetical protein
VRLALSNLASDAIKHSPQGGSGTPAALAAPAADVAEG